MKRLHEVALLLGGHAPEDAVAVNGVLDGRLVLKRRGVHVGTGAGHARPFGDGRDRAGVVSGDDAQLDALLAEVLHGGGGRRPNLVADGHAAQKLGLALDGALPREAGDAAADHDALHLVEGAAGVGHGRPLGTEDEGGGADGVALPLRRDAAGVLPGRAEGDRARVALRGHGAPGLGGAEKGAGGVVGVLRVGAGHAGKGPHDLVLPVAVGAGHARDLHLAGGDGARLVEAERVHAGEGLDAVGLLDQHLAVGKARGGDGENRGGEKHQPLGDHSQDGGGRGEDGGLDGAAVHEQRPQEEAQSKGHQDDGANLDDGAQRVEDL